jgi:hypothetical protein
MVIRERLLAEEDDDPVLSLVNLIDVFLVIIAALLLAMGSHPLNPFSAEKITVIRNAGQADMEIVIKDGRKLERYKASDLKPGSAGQGVKAGVAYRLPDGSMMYVPE